MLAGELGIGAGISEGKVTRVKFWRSEGGDEDHLSKECSRLDLHFQDILTILTSDIDDQHGPHGSPFFDSVLDTAQHPRREAADVMLLGAR